MKKYLFTLVVICFSISSFAQLKHPHFVSVNFGTSIPLSDYKEADSIVKSGANTGLSYSFEAGAYFSKVLGVGLNIGAFSNALDDESIENQLKRDFNSDQEFNVNSNNWVNGYIMLGPILSFGSQKFIADIKLLGGVMNTEKPLVNVQSSGNSTTVNQSNEVSSFSFGVNYGVHFRIKLVGKLGLRINAEGFISEQEFDTKVQESNLDGSMESLNTKTLEKEIQTLNLGLGLILTL